LWKLYLYLNTAAFLSSPLETVSSGKIVHIYTHRGGYKAGKEVGALEFLGSGRLLIISFTDAHNVSFIQRLFHVDSGPCGVSAW
jgi:hypothetical protein